MPCRLTRRQKRLEEICSPEAREGNRSWNRLALSESLCYLRRFRKGRKFKRIMKSVGHVCLGAPKFEPAADALLSTIAADLDRKYRYKLKATLCWAEYNRVETTDLDTFLKVHGGLNGCAKAFAKNKKEKASSQSRIGVKH